MKILTVYFSLKGETIAPGMKIVKQDCYACQQTD